MSLHQTLRIAPLFAAVVSSGYVQAADLPLSAEKAAPELPFFQSVDDRVTLSYLPQGTDPGVFSIRPDGSVNGKTAKQVYSFSHLDNWAYGSNFFIISLLKSDHNDPANPCLNVGVTVTGSPASCAGATEIYGYFRSTFGWNEIFNTKAFAIGPLRNISFEVGMDANAENNFVAIAKRDVVSGLQFAFNLPYKGVFNVAPMMYWQYSTHVSFSQCGLFGPGVPGVSCIADGDITYKPTWAVETEYSMDLGFLPDRFRFFSISGRAGWYGQKGTENEPLPFSPLTNKNTAVELNSEPIRLTFDAGGAVWGQKYAHFVDLFVAYQYWQNKFGFDHNVSSVCNIAPGKSNDSCTSSSIYFGGTVKF